VTNCRDAPQIPLHRAGLCLDCETVIDLVCGGCPACGSRTVATLATWLGKKGSARDVRV
jgi:hypothetical protein